ncbi:MULTISPECIES: hypothetical protein [unclassified Pantoea]|uniref:hypothetical protein n=1 Tax=unclassified Pantoea TaxID=2630326 RepID=UPI00301CF526
MTTQLSSLSNILHSVTFFNIDLFHSITSGYQIYEVMRKAIHDAEIAFHEKDKAGDAKKQCVMAALQAAAHVLGENWESLKEHFAVLIDAIIQLWNATHKKNAKSSSLHAEL